MYARDFRRDALAFDRSSVRTIDRDGHLHVGRSIISAAGVSKYWGSEIPDWQRLGLDQHRVYMMLRPADELRRAAPTFSRKPLLSDHRPLHATDHSHALTVGCIGDAEFDGQSLWAPLTVWDGAAISLIRSGETPALSAGYGYRADMTPGTWRGQKSDGRMVDIVANHVALVRQPRVPTAMVGDGVGRFSMSDVPNVPSINRAAAARPDDPLSALQQFIMTNLDQETADTINDFLDEIFATFDPSSGGAVAGAADAALRRRVASARVRRVTAADAGLRARFPMIVDR